MSKLEQQLKRIIRCHPEANLHPHSPTGPYVRAVMWQADPRILGQAFWEPETDRWVVRAFDLTVGESSLVVEHPQGMHGLGPSISRVIGLVRSSARDRALHAVAPELASLVRSLRGRA
jgi:hypothetical protein